MTIQEKRKALLDETVKYYSEDTTRRCVNGRCFYSPKNANNSNSEGCAIGRKISPELQLRLDRQEFTGINITDNYNMLPDELKELGKDFLTELQSLHDDGRLWHGVTGLTEQGQNRVKWIEKEFC